MDTKASHIQPGQSIYSDITATWQRVATVHTNRDGLTVLTGTGWRTYANPHTRLHAR